MDFFDHNTIHRIGVEYHNADGARTHLISDKKGFYSEVD